MLPLTDGSQWLRVFDARGGGIFVPTDNPPKVGTEVRVDLTVAPGGPRLILRGNVTLCRAQREGGDPAGCGVRLIVGEKEKVNFINGYVRGGLINRRERRRLPLRLPVVFGGVSGPQQTSTRDINEDGLFIVTDFPLPEETVLHLALAVPEHAQPISLRGIVRHTVLTADEDVPGMGIQLQQTPVETAAMMKVVDRLEALFLAGALPEEIIT